jgi:hypothetical protein
MLTYNPNLYPTDGWYFMDANATRHPASGSANGLNALVAVVTDYRKRNKIPLGDPRTEVIVQLCSRQPGFCRDSDPSVPPPKLMNSQFGQKVLEWINRMVRDKRDGKLRRVSDSEATRRAEICARCPKQVALPLTCNTCSENVAKLRKGLLDNRTPVHQGLGGCIIFDDDLQTVVHFETGTAPNVDIPNSCWRKQR